MFENRCPAEPRIQGDAQRLLQVMVNLLGNARDASGAGDRVIIEAEPAGKWLQVSVVDEGEGIDDSVRDHLFEPFTATKPPARAPGSAWR